MNKNIRTKNSRNSKTTQKETQGHKKWRQAMDDFRRNKYFMATIEKIRNGNLGSNKIKDKKVSEDLRLLKRVLKRLVANSEQGYEKYFMEIAKLYGLDGHTIGWHFLNGNKQNNDWDTRDVLGFVDFCYITDTHDEVFKSIATKIPAEIDLFKKSHVEAFPISIDINRFASKRDVLKYIEQRWKLIEYFLNKYRNPNKIRLRQRKLSRELVDYIWDHQSSSLKQIKKEIDKKFTHNGLTYYEIGNILYQEKHRRLKRIKIGR